MIIINIFFLKVENRLTRKYLYNRNVTCNDGSAAGYYIRRNTESRVWIIYLEGGWFCHDQASCEARWLRLRTLMSSDRSVLETRAEKEPSRSLKFYNHGEGPS